MNRLLLVCSAVLLLAGCAGTSNVSPEPIITTKDVNKPVATSCVPPSVDDPPAYPDTSEALQAAAGTLDRFIQLLLAGRDLRIARSAETEPVIKGCRK